MVPRSTHYRRLAKETDDTTLESTSRDSSDYSGFSAFMNELPNLHKCVGLVGNAINGDFGFGFKCFTLMVLF